MFNLAVDDKHVTLAFGLKWIEALATRFEHIDVVTMTKGDYQLPKNVSVWSVGRERGYPEWIRALRFYWLICRILRKRRIDIVFTHMIPIFAVLFWPISLITGLKNVLWYAHGATPVSLKLAHRLVAQVVSSTLQGFRLQSNKVIFIGQGIDAAFCQYTPRQAGKKFKIVTVGRLAPSKGLDLLISVLNDWRTNFDWHLTIVGDGTSDAECGYANNLRQQATSSLGLDKVSFTGRMSSEEIAKILTESDIFINLSSTGSLDKAMVEAMATGCPVVSSNDAFRAIAEAEGFSQCAIQHSSLGLLEALNRLSNMDYHTRNQLGEKQARVAHRDHTLSDLISRLEAVLIANKSGKE